MKLFKVIVLLFLALGAAQAARLKQGEVLRVWKKGEAPPTETADCRVGDTIIVEVRDFVGWLMDGLDNQVFADDLQVKELERGSLIAMLINARQFHKAVALITTEDPAELQTRALLKGLITALYSKTGQAADAAAVDWKSGPDEREKVLSFLRNFQAKKMAALRLELDHDTLAGVPVANGADSEIPRDRRPPETSENSYHWLEFRLDVLGENTEFWGRLRGSPSFRRSLGVTLSLDLGTRAVELPSRVEVGAKGGFDFGLSIIPRYRFWAALVLWALASWMLLRLSGSTDLLRDPDGEIRPDGRRCFSLARSQMACWFLLVVGAFLFLWVVTGNYDTLNDTCLWLIGIGAGTALGAAAISDPKERDARAFPVRIGHGVEDGKISGIIKAKVDEVKAICTRADAEVSVDGKQVSAFEHLAALEAQVQSYEGEFVKKSVFKRLMDDWLQERGLYSFHRYQMLVWTLAMALIFVVEVWRTLKMPVFNMTALALMGISSGTYLGFKLKEQEPAKK